MRRLLKHTLLPELATREYIAQFLFFALPIGLAAAALISIFYHLDVQMVGSRIHATEHHHLELRDAIIRQNVADVVSALRLLASLQASEPVIHTAQGSVRPPVGRGALEFCEGYTEIFEIRTVDADGAERSRLRCRPGSPQIYATSELRQRIDPDLLAELARLHEDHIFISTISSGTDLGNPTAQVYPSVQFSTPLANSRLGPRRFLVFKVDLRQLISDVMLDTGQGGTMILVEETGRFVRKPQGDEMWGDTLIPGKERAFGEAYPAVWRALQESRHGEIETGDGLFSFTALDLNRFSHNAGHPDENGHTSPGRSAPVHAPVWRVVSHIPTVEIAAGRESFRMKSMLLIPAPVLAALYLAHLGLRRRRAMRWLEQSQKYQRQIMDSVVDGILTTDPSGGIQHANAATRNLFGFDAGAELPRNVSALMPLQRLEPDSDLTRLWQGGSNAQGPANGRLILDRLDGSSFPAEVELTAAELGGARQFIWVIRDISEREAFEAKQNAERMRFFHQTKMAEVGLIAAGVIHEVGNPISAISGVASQLMDEARRAGGDWGERALSHVSMISDQARRLSTITQEISDFVRMQPGKEEIFDLNSLVRTTVRLLQYDSRWKHILLELNLDPTIPAIRGIQDQIAQVLMNLLVNASDAVLHKALVDRRVEVRTERADGHVLIKVVDNGHGMDEEAKRKAFESFFTTKPEGRGTGLGLNMCQMIVEGHNGRIDFISEEGQGATFRVALPVPEQLASATG